MKTHTIDMSKARKLGITEFPYKEHNGDGDCTYYEESNGKWVKYLYQNQREIYSIGSDKYWTKRYYNKSGYQTSYNDSNGEWNRCTYDENNYELYYENSDGYWSKRTRDERGHQTYYENSEGEWNKYVYDEKGRETYNINKNGYWNITMSNENPHYRYV
jgi:hypothetical protein